MRHPGTRDLLQKGITGLMALPVVEELEVVEVEQR
jgi:hypothetical protein